jgi:hypothetical protein
MQITFLPYPSFPLTASCLHDLDLQEARSAALHYLTAILYPQTATHSVLNHPCRLMWQEYPNALARYGLTLCCEWSQRGHQDMLIEHFATLQNKLRRHKQDPSKDPWWLYLPALSRSHMSLLVARRRNWYSAFFPPSPLPHAEPTFWPVGKHLEPMPF